MTTYAPRQAGTGLKTTQLTPEFRTLRASGVAPVAALLEMINRRSETLEILSAAPGQWPDHVVDLMQDLIREIVFLQGGHRVALSKVPVRWNSARTVRIAA